DCPNPLVRLFERELLVAMEVPRGGEGGTANAVAAKDEHRLAVSVSGVHLGGYPVQVGEDRSVPRFIVDRNVRRRRHVLGRFVQDAELLPREFEGVVPTS